MATPHRSIEGKLSPGQRDVLELSATGMTYRQIAGARHSSLRTVKNQMYDAREALGAANTIDAFRILGWLKVPPRRHSPKGDLS